MIWDALRIVAMGRNNGLKVCFTRKKNIPEHDYQLLFKCFQLKYSWFTVLWLLNFYLSIFGYPRSLFLHSGFPLVAVSGGDSSCSAWTSHCGGVSLWSLGSRARGLSSCGSRTWSAGSVVVAHWLSCSVACGIFLDQGWNPCPLNWQADSLLLDHQPSLSWLLTGMMVLPLQECRMLLVRRTYFSRVEAPARHQSRNIALQTDGDMFKAWLPVQIWESSTENVGLSWTWLSPLGVMVS